MFLPHTLKNSLDCDYLAGYKRVKQDIEDTVLLALTHGEVYDQINADFAIAQEKLPAFWGSSEIARPLVCVCFSPHL